MTVAVAEGIVVAEFKVVSFGAELSHASRKRRAEVTTEAMKKALLIT